MRLEQEVNIYGDAEILKRFQAAETSISVVQGNISALISESELIELQNSHTTMYSQMASLKLDVDDLELSFSDLQTKYNTVTGQYTELSSKVAEYKAGVDGLSADITAVEQNLEKNYSTTTEMNAAIEASVDGLSSTVSKTYATTTQVTAAQNNAISSAKSYTDTQKTSALETAKGYADDAEAAANANTKNLLKNYSTTIQMNSAIKQKADEISTSVSATYATKTSVTTAQNNAVSTAKDYTDSAKASALTTAKGYADDAEAAANANTANRLKSYSTTAQMNSAINQKANEITASVSSTYATKSALNNANSEIDALQTWRSEASLKITDSAIVATVTSSSSWATKADKANLISQINQSAEQVAISASKIKLEGIITANGNFKILADGSMETIRGKIGGWTIDGNQLMNYTSDFNIRIQAPTVYGTNGNGLADVITVRDMHSNSWPFVLSSDGTLAATKCILSGGTIGGWTIQENQLMCYTDDFNIRLQAPTVYGSTGDASEILTVRDMVNNTWPFILRSDGTLVLGGEFDFRPNGFPSEPKSMLRVGGWQIKKTYDYLGYDEISYWDTPDSQENGICAHGPWVIWGGWNGGVSIDTDNYKFVVTDKGVCKAMSWVTGSRVEWKENIVPYTKSALQEIANSEVYYYDLKDRGKGGWKEGRHIGFVIGDGYSVSPDILDGGGGAIDMYSALAIAYKAIQEQQEEIEELKKKIKEVVA